MVVLPSAPVATVAVSSPISLAIVLPEESVTATCSLVDSALEVMVLRVEPSVLVATTRTLVPSVVVMTPKSVDVDASEEISERVELASERTLLASEAASLTMEVTAAEGSWAATRMTGRRERRVSFMLLFWGVLMILVGVGKLGVEKNEKLTE